MLSGQKLGYPTMSWLWQAWVEGIAHLVCKGTGSRSHAPVPQMPSHGGVVETNSSELPESGNIYLTQAPVS